MRLSRSGAGAADIRSTAAAPGAPDVATGGAAAVVERAPAKVNLSLHVTGRRDDGYHTLDSIVVFARDGAADTLRFAWREEGVELVRTGPFAALVPADADNIVLRAAAALRDAAGVRGQGARITLDKALPVAAGIGGGSADAAAALRGLCRLWDLAPSAGELARIALGLGADVPVCLGSRPARMRGIGGELTAIGPWPEVAMLLVNPLVPVVTGEVFRTLAVRTNPPIGHVPAAIAGAEALAGFLGTMRNDLEAPARIVAPVIGDVLEWLRGRSGCLFARMSGAGGTCFGLFADQACALAAQREAHSARRDWWACAVTV